jgi:molybdopterin converting factor small subunit
MRVRVQFFSHLRDLASASDIEVDLQEGAAVSDLLQKLYLDKPALASVDKTILTAVGLEFVDRGHPLAPGDEVSIMPPVQGG